MPNQVVLGLVVVLGGKVCFLCSSGHFIILSYVSYLKLYNLSDARGVFL